MDLYLGFVLILCALSLGLLFFVRRKLSLLPAPIAQRYRRTFFLTVMLPYFALSPIQVIAILHLFNFIFLRGVNLDHAEIWVYAFMLFPLLGFIVFMLLFRLENARDTFRAQLPLKPILTALGLCTVPVPFLSARYIGHFESLLLPFTAAIGVIGAVMILLVDGYCCLFEDGLVAGGLRYVRYGDVRYIGEVVHKASRKTYFLCASGREKILLYFAPRDVDRFRAAIARHCQDAVVLDEDLTHDFPVEVIGR